jgi:hypothetical protein
MTNDKATPRPWKFEKHFDGNYFGNILAQYPEGTWRTITVQLKYGTPEENQANASLIVKAVNSHDALLEACKEALKDLEFYEDQYRVLCSERGGEQKQETFEYLRLAIAQAKG